VDDRASIGCATLPLVPEEPYRAALPVEPDPYPKAWANVRRRKRVYYASVLFALVSIFGLCPTALVNQLFGGEIGPNVVAFFVAPLVLVLVADGWLSAVPCPRCGTRNVWRRRTTCCGCRIPVGMPKSALSTPFRCPACGHELVAILVDDTPHRCTRCGVAIDMATKSVVLDAEKKSAPPGNAADPRRDAGPRSGAPL
jgi:hypothetical protein